MRVFLTGVTGNLGLHLVPALLKEGHELTLLNAPNTVPLKIEGPAMTTVTADLLDTRAYEERLIDQDAIIHMAAVTHTNDTALYYRINTEGTSALLDAARTRKVPRFIFVSTRAVGRAGGGYSHSKERAEKLVEESGLDWTIVRPAEVYGVTENEAIAKVISTIEHMPLVPVIGDGSYRIAPVHIDDVVQALTAILSTNNSIGKTYTLAGPDDLTYNRFIALVLSAKKIRKPVIHIPLSIIRSAAWMFAFLKVRKPFIVRDQVSRLILEKSADISRACADLGFAPISLEHFLAQGRN